VEPKRGEGGGSHLTGGSSNHQVSRPMRDIKAVDSRGENTTTDMVEAKIGMRGLADFNQPTQHAKLIPNDLLTGR
jgi:hypothetical protein